MRVTGSKVSKGRKPSEPTPFPQDEWAALLAQVMDTSDGRGLTTRQIADRLGKGIEATRLIIGKALAKGLIQRCVKVAGTSIDGKAFYAMTFELVKGDAV